MSNVVKFLTSPVMHILENSRKFIFHQLIPWPIPEWLEAQKPIIKTTNRTNEIQCKDLSKGKYQTPSSGLSDVCLMLYLVPRVLEIHTSKPLSAKIYAKDSSGALISHVIPSCRSIQNIYKWSLINYTSTINSCHTARETQLSELKK